MVSLINFKTFGETGDLDDTRHVQLSDSANTKTSSSSGGGKNNQDFSSKAPLNGPQHNSPLSSRKEHFEIRWTNLNYVVEPKWYQRDWRAALTGGGGPQQQQQQQQKSAGTGAETGSSATTKGTTSILDSLRGSVKSGQVTAILGPSGAGKTSLLGCLTGKNKSGVSGCVQVISTNGGPGRMEPLSICTIPQKDYLLNQLTVRENLWFASRLKHPIDGFDHDSNIERVVELLKLESCIDTKISKISGGQYKRVSIAQELLSNPDILILDEPTSGLDSLTCYKTVMVLRDLARRSPNPMAIIVTIHQPQREVFDLFNHVYILAVGGRCIYEGHPSQSIKTINECSGGLQFDADQYNPASYLVEIASVEFGEKPIEALVEHQRNEFTRKTNAQDHRNYLISGGGGGGADLADQQRLTVGQFGANGSNLTPNLKKRSHSPMISRFKSTLSSLTGSASSPHISSLAMGRAGQMGENNLNLSRNSHKLPPLGSLTDGDSVGGGGGGGAAYSNDAYESNQTLNELGLDNRQDQLSMNLNYINNNNSTNANNNYADNSSRASSDHLNHQNHQQRNGNNLRQQNLIYPETISVVASGDKQRDNNIVSNYTLDQKQQLSSVTPDDDGEFYLDTRLQTHKHNHKGHFLRHCQLLTKRSWLCLCKDPMLTTLRFSAHIIVPLLITLVYGSRVGKPNACPLYESEMDLIDYARRGAKRLLNLQDELRCTFENVGLYFLSIYAFTFSTMCLTSLSFPLSMHVLLKEVRNGWYSIPTFFIGKTLADFPLEFILPVLTLMITYPLTGQPSSYLEWRFILATGIFVVTSLIAQTQGLIFGALFMNAMQAAVFVAPVSTTPLILLSGFLIRISQMPLYLQKLSTLSYFRYAIESLTIIRYGFGQCECDPQVVNGKPVSASGVPDQLRTMTNYWLSTFDVATNDANSLEGSDYSTINETITDIITTTVAPSSLGANLSALATTTTSEPPQVDFFQDLTVLLARANSFGADIKTCKDLKPYPMIDFSLEDDQLYVWCAALVATLFLSKVVNYYVVKYSVKWRL